MVLAMKRFFLYSEHIFFMRARKAKSRIEKSGKGLKILQNQPKTLNNMQQLKLSKNKLVNFFLNELNKFIQIDFFVIAIKN